MTVLRWAFGHQDSAGSFIEVPEEDVAGVWAGLRWLLGAHVPLVGDPVVTEQALGSACLHAGAASVAEHFDGLAGLDGQQWWAFLATGSFHGGLVSAARRA